MKRLALTNRDDFELWLFYMSEIIEKFRQRFSDTFGEEADFDFSINSLDKLESWILLRYTDSESMLASSESQEVDSIARYIGQTFRRQLGGYWDIELQDSKKVFFGLPILVGFSGYSTPICPHALATTVAARRQGNYLSTILKNIKKRQSV